jgi:hypothetical protein
MEWRYTGDAHMILHVPVECFEYSSPMSFLLGRISHAPITERYPLEALKWIRCDDLRF